MRLSEYLILLFSPFIASFCLLILVAKSRNGSSANDGRSRKERPLRRTPSATGQDANQEGTVLRTHISLSHVFLDLFCFVFLIDFFFDGDSGNA